MTHATLPTNDVATLGEPRFEARVTEKLQASPDVVVLTLQSPGDGDLSSWTPGAHVDIALPNGLVRQYSLCGSPEDLSTYRVGILRDPGSRGGSTYIHDELSVGDTVLLRGPRNHFELVPSSRYVFIAGGIGVTPLIPMATAALHAGHVIEFIYCARSRAAMPFLSELEERFGDRLRVHADDESGLFDLEGLFRQPRPDTLVYVCGPTPFLDATIRATNDWPSGAVHFERFSALELDEDSNVPFDVELARDGRVLSVPADHSLLAVLNDNGIRVLSSCAEGTCGTCEVAVLGGDRIVHRDAVLSPEEQASGEMMMVCVSRCAGGRLLLDL